MDIDQVSCLSRRQYGVSCCRVVGQQLRVVQVVEAWVQEFVGRLWITPPSSDKQSGKQGGDAQLSLEPGLGDLVPHGDNPSGISGAHCYHQIRDGTARLAAVSFDWQLKVAQNVLSQSEPRDERSDSL